MGFSARVKQNRWLCRVDGAGLRRVGGSWFLSVAALLWAFFSAGAPSAWAQVTVLLESRAAIYQQALRGFQQGFENSDQVEVIFLEGNGRALETRLSALRKDPPRLIVAIGTQAARLAKKRLPNVPLLYCLVLRPAQNRLVGANIGGVALNIELSQQFESIQKTLPRVRRIGVVYDPLTSGRLVRQAQEHLNPGVQLVGRPARTPREAARAIEDLLSNVLGREDAFWLLWDSVIANPANFRSLVRLSWQYKVPLITPARPFVEAGALMSVGANYVEAGRRAGRMAQQVVRNEARPEDFVAVPPADAVVTINREVARRLGMTFPPNLKVEFLGRP